MNFEFRHEREKKLCNKCNLIKNFKHFDRILDTPQRKAICNTCEPPECVAPNMEWLTRQRETVLCKICNGQLVYWYRKDGKLCDVFRYAQQGYTLQYIKRFLL